MIALHFRPQQIQAIVDHARENVPDEVCGLIAGNGNRVVEIIPIDNIAADGRVTFEMEPMALLSAFKQIEAGGQQVMGVYHSHPANDPIPSQTDIRAAQQHLPGCAHVIISLNQTQPRLQGWHITIDQVNPIEIVIGQGTSQAEAPMTRTHLLAVLIITILSLAFLWSISLTLLPPAPSLPIP